MTAILVRKLSEETRQALKARAKANGRSAEAEIRDIVETALRKPHGQGLGDRLAEIGRIYGGIEIEVPRRSELVEPLPEFE